MRRWVLDLCNLVRSDTRSGRAKGIYFAVLVVGDHSALPWVAVLLWIPEKALLGEDLP